MCFVSRFFYNFYFSKYMIKANPSPNRNGFAFILSGETSVNYPNTFYFIKGSFAFIITL